MVGSSSVTQSSQHSHLPGGQVDLSFVAQLWTTLWPRAIGVGTSGVLSPESTRRCRPPASVAPHEVPQGPFGLALLEGRLPLRPLVLPSPASWKTVLLGRQIHRCPGQLLLPLLHHLPPPANQGLWDPHLGHSVVHVVFQALLVFRRVSCLLVSSQATSKLTCWLDSPATCSWFFVWETQLWSVFSTAIRGSLRGFHCIRTSHSWSPEEPGRIVKLGTANLPTTRCSPNSVQDQSLRLSDFVDSLRCPRSACLSRLNPSDLRATGGIWSREIPRDQLRYQFESRQDPFFTQAAMTQGPYRFEPKHVCRHTLVYAVHVKRWNHTCLYNYTSITKWKHKNSPTQKMGDPNKHKLNCVTKVVKTTTQPEVLGITELRAVKSRRYDW